MDKRGAFSWDIVNLVHTPTDKTLADMLTKGLSAEVRLKLENCLSDILVAEAAATAGNKAAKEKVVIRRAAK